MLANIGSDFRKSGCKGRKEERGRKGMREGGRCGEKEGGRREEGGKEKRTEGGEREGGKEVGRRREGGERRERRGLNINIFTTQPKPWRLCRRYSGIEQHGTRAHLVNA